MVLKDNATFAVTPFVLTQKMGSRVLLHTYPIEKDIEKTLIATRSVTYVEVKDDRVQVQQLFELFNGGKSAWVPDEYIIPLPPEFTAFTTQQGMTDVGVDSLPKKGAKLHGTFAPGQHSIEFRWQLPYAGEARRGLRGRDDAAHGDGARDRSCVAPDDPGRHRFPRAPDHHRRHGTACAGHGEAGPGARRRPSPP